MSYAHNASSSHIPQPPHTSGASYQGLRTRIDPSQIPSATDAIELDRSEWNSKAYSSLTSSTVPQSTTDYTAIDQGNSTPNFVRLSTWNVPCSSRLARDCKVPISVVIQPFVDPEPYYNQDGVNENEVPVVYTPPEGPPRCAQCRGYINPACVFTAGGNRWKCNLCRAETDVTPEYFCNLGPNSMRLDHLQRPELNRGTIDFVVSSDEYWAANPPPRLTLPYYSPEPAPTGPRAPKPMNYFFALDVSHDAVQSGFLQTACNSIRSMLFGDSACFPPECGFALITYDRAIHFYDISSDSVPMLVMPDVEEVFIPFRTNLFVNPSERREVLESLLDTIPSRFQDNLNLEAAAGSAIRVSTAALAGLGGHTVLFLSTMPTLGAGSLTGLGPRNEQEVKETEKEKSLYLPRNPDWRLLADECVQEGIGVSYFLGNHKEIDLGSIALVPSLTGGEIFFHPRFDAKRHAGVLDSQLQRLMRRKTGYNCAMRVRTSVGLRVSGYTGNFARSTPQNLSMSVLTADSAVSAQLEVAKTMDPREQAYLQSAVLYTTVEGERRVRVCNVGVQVVELAGNVFGHADMDALVCHMAREAATRITQNKMSDIREDTTEICAAALLGYRQMCAASSAPSQLILPEALRTFPVYNLGILKSKILKPSTVNPDARVYAAHRVLSMSARSLKQHLYPRLMALHDLEDASCFPDPETGKLRIPSLMRNSHMFMRANGVYLIDNEEQTIIWVGHAASPQLLQDLFGVDDINNIDTQMLPVLETLFSAQVRNLLTHWTNQRGGRLLKFDIVRQNMDGLEIEFSDMLVEDQNNHSMSYADYLTVLHKQISNVLTEGGSLSGETSMRGTPW